MPDEFPTLEAVAALATLAALVRAVQVYAAMRELRRLSAEIARPLRAGDHQAARRVIAESEAHAFSAAASALLEALGHGPVEPRALARTVEQAARRVQKRSRRASASGLLVSALLVGLLVHAFVSRVSPHPRAAPSSFFDLLVVVGVVVLAVGVALNQLLTRETRRAAERMVASATAQREELR
jgi:hypothetical protein